MGPASPRAEMFHRFQAFFRPRPIEEQLRRESRTLLLRHLRVGVVLALIFVPMFIPLDFVRMPDRFAGALLVRLAGCMALLALLPLMSVKTVVPWAEWLAAVAMAV